MTSPAYRLFRQAIIEKKQVACVYKGHRRELCPHIIGHTGGEEKVLAFQFAGETSTTRPCRAAASGAASTWPRSETRG